MRRVSLVLAVVGALVLLSGLRAADEKKAQARPGAGAAIDAMVKDLKLSDEQKTKLENVKKEYGPKLQEANAKVNAVLTPEQRKTVEETRKKAQSEGKKGKEVDEAVATALNLPDDQKAKVREAMQERAKVMQEARKEVMSILTDEQKAELRAKTNK